MAAAQAPKLVIVESPAKAKTIEKFLGRGYHVEASQGHVRDLPKNRLSVDVKKNFEPKYAIIKGKEELVEKLSPILPRGIEIVSAYFPDIPFSNITTAEYLITLEKRDDTPISSLVKETFTHPVELLKKTKSGEKAINITPLIKALSAEDKGCVCEICAELSASQNEYLNPELLVKGLMLEKKIGDVVDSWQTTRIRINFKEN